MPASGPHYLLFAEAMTFHEEGSGWRFALHPVGEGEPIAAQDVEPDADLNRLELLALVRGLEALDAPSRVTLLCGSRYVRRGIRYDLAAWREQNWQWERFDRLVPIRDLDLWQRVDRALTIHQVECCWGLWTASSPVTERGRRSARHHSPTVMAPMVRFAEATARSVASDDSRLDSCSPWPKSALSRTA